MVFKVVFVRHGESEWNVANKFTGWTNVDLSPAGVIEAQEAGKVLQEKGYNFDIAFTSVLKRAIKTCWTVLDFSNQTCVPVYNRYRLNERHYGALQGLDKSETAAKHGEEQVLIWRRAYAIPPPELESSDARHPANDALYAHLPKEVLPATECLKDTVDRVLPLWFDEICPQIMAGKNVLVAAHGNSLRAIVKHLDDLSEDAILKLNIPTAVPLVYELDEKTLKPVKSYYLMDEEEVKAKIAAVANQGKAK
eukprot:GHVH01007275.1.p1 GENE.GHVH01007275.1~~GHVH01007275.1.p1  ORF type:complete len:266 (-),score=42.17 GHVH01007275.1:33-785(-)